MDAEIYHLWEKGPIFECMQKSGVFADSKTFVDMPLKVSKVIDRAVAFFVVI